MNEPCVRKVNVSQDVKRTRGPHLSPESETLVLNSGAPLDAKNGGKSFPSLLIVYFWLREQLPTCVICFFVFFCALQFPYLNGKMTLLLCAVFPWFLEGKKKERERKKNKKKRNRSLTPCTAQKLLSHIHKKRAPPSSTRLIFSCQ